MKINLTINRILLENYRHKFIDFEIDYAYENSTIIYAVFLRFCPAILWECLCK